MCSIGDIFAKAIVIQCEVLVKQILQLLIYSETLSVSQVVYAHIKKMFCAKSMM